MASGRDDPCCHASILASASSCQRAAELVSPSCDVKASARRNPLSRLGGARRLDFMLAKVSRDPVHQRPHRSVVIVEQFIRHHNAERFLRKVGEFNECEVIVDAVHDKRIRREDLSRLNRPAMVFRCHPGDDPCNFLRDLLRSYRCHLLGRSDRRGPRKSGHWRTLATTRFINLLLPNMFRFLDSTRLAGRPQLTEFVTPLRMPERRYGRQVSRLGMDKLVEPARGQNWLNGCGRVHSEVKRIEILLSFNWSILARSAF